MEKVLCYAVIVAFELNIRMSRKLGWFCTSVRTITFDLYKLFLLICKTSVAKWDPSIK